MKKLRWEYEAVKRSINFLLIGTKRELVQYLVKARHILPRSEVLSELSCLPWIPEENLTSHWKFVLGNARLA